MKSWYLPTLLVWFVLLCCPLPAQTRSDFRSLLPNRPIERTMKDGETHSYKISLKAGKYFRVNVNQLGIDVVISMSNPDGKVFVKRDRPNGSSGQESLSFIVATSGEYQFDVIALGEKVEAGKYEIRSEVPRLPTNADKIRIEAETIFQDAQEEDAESVKQACEKYEKAVALWQEIGDKYAEALTHTSLGYGRERLDEIEKAIVAHETASKLYEKLKDKSLQARSLTVLCKLNAFLQKFDIAIERYRQAKAIYRKLTDNVGEKELNKFNNVADTYFKKSFELFQKQEPEAIRESLKYLAITLAIYHEVENKEWEALTLSALGRTTYALGEKRKSLEYYSQALPILKAIRDKSGTAAVLRNIGGTYNSLGEKQNALDYLNQALSLFKEVSDTEAKFGEGETLNVIGLVYDSLGEKQKALNYYNQALPLYKELKDKNGEANTLNNIGVVYKSLNEMQKALDYFFQVLPLMRISKDKTGEATVLNNFGAVYDDLGEKQKALDYFNQALLVYRETKDKSGEATVLNNIGKVNYSSNEFLKALDYFNQALPIWKETENKAGESRTLNNIGLVYRSIVEKQKSLDYYEQALSLNKAVGDKSGEATILSNIGNVYDDLGEKQKALEYYYRALPLRKAVGDKSGEAVTLNSLINFYEFKNPRLAVFYSKQSVTAIQQIRSYIQGADKESQKTFLKSVEAAYRYLANLLIEQGRLAEAHQILNAFKDQQYFDFNPQTAKKLSPLAANQRESELSSRYALTSDKVVKIGSQIEELKRAIISRQPTDEEKIQLQNLDIDIKNAADEFLAVLKQAETEFSGASDSVKDKNPDVADTREMQATLRELELKSRQKAVAIYTLVSQRNLQVLIITPERLIPVNFPINDKDLDKKAKQFFSQLSEVDGQTNAPKFSESEVQKTGKELYNIIFAPVSVKLKKLGVNPDVLMWSLDGSLRYIPVGALYDGKEYLAKRYRNVVFTRADSERMLAPVSPVWTGTVFYNSKEYLLPVNGKMFRFEELQYTEQEVKIIFGTPQKLGLIASTALSDEEFTKDSLLKNLQQHRPLVHIASHFKLEPGDANSSFLLLGDGTVLSLANITGEADDLFAGVELLTLSACETGAQKERQSDGREIDSFAELAQRKGARAILASLWKVDDESTSQLMMQFYQTRQTQNLTKAEALQRAQQSLLKSKNFSHPYYWAPFILIGNWR